MQIGLAMFGDSVQKGILNILDEGASKYNLDTYKRELGQDPIGKIYLDIISN